MFPCNVLAKQPRAVIYARWSTEWQARGFISEEAYLDHLFTNWCRRLKGQAPLTLLEV